MSWFPQSNNSQLLSIYKNNIKDRIKALKKAKRVKQYAEEIALLDPDRLDYADVFIISQLNKDYQLFAEESDLIRADIESFIPIWLARKQDKSPFPSENLLEDLL
jgi:hypothetical protein